MKKPNPRHPKSRGDFGDIGDIFGKPSNHAGLRVFESGDILGMSPGDGDVGDALSHACLPMRAKAHLVTICHRPREWPFLGLIRGRIESTGAAHTQGYLAREIPGSDVKRILLMATSPA